MSVIEIDGEDDAWRLVCEQGHAAVAPTNNHFWCRTCANHWENVDPEYDEVRDRKTGRLVTRDDIEVAFDAPGVHYA